MHGFGNRDRQFFNASRSTVYLIETTFLFYLRVRICTPQSADYCLHEHDHPCLLQLFWWSPESNRCLRLPLVIVSTFASQPYRLGLITALPHAGTQLCLFHHRKLQLGNPFLLPQLPCVISSVFQRDGLVLRHA